MGDPLERFHEDALRIMRAVRFSAQLGFEIEAETKAGDQQTDSESSECQCGEDPGRACEASCLAASGLPPGGV